MKFCHLLAPPGKIILATPWKKSSLCPCVGSYLSKGELFAGSNVSTRKPKKNISIVEFV